jgi:hypothetical protein
MIHVRQLGLADCHEIAIGDTAFTYLDAAAPPNGDTLKSRPCRMNEAVLWSTRSQGNSGSNSTAGINASAILPAAAIAPSWSSVRAIVKSKPPELTRA